MEPRIRRLIKWVATPAITLVAFAAIAGFYVFYRAMPAYSGTERLPGLASPFAHQTDSIAEILAVMGHGAGGGDRSTTARPPWHHGDR